MSSDHALDNGRHPPATSPKPADLPHDVAVSVRDVSKAYDVYASPSDRLWAAITLSKPEARRFWALKHISFDLHRGESLGIIGRNGSGKSTLMQIIAGTLSPTSGHVMVRGRIAALLELGSGFNPRFTGRENIFLAGAILGLSRADMLARFDDIAGFADIGEFIDRPVHTYSTGMHSRLAFSVAACVEPDVLILDEILSVGDAEFQSRCVARMRQLLDRGVTLLFVSHNADAIKSMCSKGLLLLSGKQGHFGDSASAVDHYFNHVREVTNRRAMKKAAPVQAAGQESVERTTDVPSSMRYGTGHAQVQHVRVINADGTPAEAFHFDEPVTIEIAFQAIHDLDRLDVSFLARDRVGVDILGTSAFDEGVSVPDLRAGESAVIRFRFSNVLRPGNYGVSVTLARRPTTMGDGLLVLDHLDACAAFSSLAMPTRRIKHKVFVPTTVEVSADVSITDPAPGSQP